MIDFVLMAALAVAPVPFGIRAAVLWVATAIGRHVRIKAPACRVIRNANAPTG